MTHKKKKPTEGDMLEIIGRRGNLWSELRAYLAAHYDHVPELSVGRKEHEWTIRYRRGGKTLVTLEPEKGVFKVLIVLGWEEDAKACSLNLSRNVKGAYENSRQYHDGCWLWIRPASKKDLESVKALLSIKRKPK